VLARINIANRLTLLRIGLVPVFVACMMIDNVWGYFAGTVVFILAAITDHYDGKLARRHNLMTDFGRLMDPLADKLLMCAAFLLFVATWPKIPAWIVIVILGREFLISGLRALAAAKGRVIAAQRSGKLKTVVQITFAITVLVLMTGRKVLQRFTELWTGRHDYWLQNVCLVLALVTLGFTVYSGWSYLRQNKDLLADGLGNPAS